MVFFAGRIRRSLIFLVLCSRLTKLTVGLNGGTPQLLTYNGWKVFEVITEGDNPSDVWRLPGTLDGAGAFLANENELRIQVNHELAASATISEVAIHVPSLKAAIRNMIQFNSLQGQKFLIGAQRAYRRYSLDAGRTWKTDRGNFRRFCSAQSYSPRPRGFVDQLYITGEETGRKLVGRLVAIHSTTRDMYILSGVTGSSGEGNPGFPFDSFENAAWIDTKENKHIALVLSADYGSESLMLYIGKRRKGIDGQASNDVMARNGLAYGSWYFLKGTYPNLNQSTTGTFGTGKDGALSSSKMEDVDTSPTFPTRVVLGDQNSGVFILDFDLQFGGNQFKLSRSSFSIKKIANHIPNNNLNGADNADWTAATTLKGKSYPEGIIFMNEDTATGEIWQMNPEGKDKVRIGASKTGGESTGILDISELVGYAPGSIVLSNNFASPADDARNLPSAMNILINPKATVATSSVVTQERIPAPVASPVAPPIPAPTLAPIPAPTAAPKDPPTNRPISQPTLKPVAIPAPSVLSVLDSNAELATAAPVGPTVQEALTPKEPSGPDPPAGTPTALPSSTPAQLPVNVSVETTSTPVPQRMTDPGGDSDTVSSNFEPNLLLLGIASAIVVVIVALLSVTCRLLRKKKTVAENKRRSEVTSIDSNSHDDHTEDSITEFHL